MFLVAIATGAGAAEPFIAIADVENGRALVPEGSVVPAGVRFIVTSGEERVPLVFAYAPAAKFVAARKAIEAGRASAAPRLVRYVVAPESGEATTNGLDAVENGDPVWYYLYFSDGSYTSALRHVYSSGSYTYYGSGTEAYSAPGSYWTGTVDVSLSSNLVWGPTGGPYFDPYGSSDSCSVNNYGGGCGTSYPYVGTTQPFSATVESSAQISQRFSGCWTNPNSLCYRVFNGTIEITFP